MLVLKIEKKRKTEEMIEKTALQTHYACKGNIFLRQLMFEFLIWWELSGQSLKLVVQLISTR